MIRKYVKITVYVLVFAIVCENGFINLVCALDTKFTHDRGFYDAPFDVVISTDVDGITIKYTLDGSDPRVSPTALDGLSPCGVRIDPGRLDGRWPTPAVTLRACAVDNGTELSNVDTQTYIFLDEVIEQGEIKPSGTDVFWTTSMDPEITQDPAYQPIMHDALLSIPTMSVVMDFEDLFGTSGIHRGYNLARDKYEKPCSLELIYPYKPQFSGFKGFQVDCGIRIQGGGGRWDNGLYDHKQSFGIRFRREHGTGTLNYPIFESAPYHSDSEAGEYDKLILRAGHNKSWGATWDNVHTTYTRDQFGRDLQISLSGIGSRGTFVHLYLNGIYWGLYNPCERPDHAFSASYFGGTKEDYYSGKRKGGSISGDSSRFNTWRNSVSSTRDFDTLQQYLAVDAYLDMALLGAYANPGDYPQYYFGNGNNPAGPINFYQWDIEDAFGGGSRRSGNPSAGKLGACYEFDTMWSNNTEFRMRLADRAYKACFNQGVLTDDKVIEQWLRTCDYIYLAIVGESARWGDERFGERGSRNWGGNQYHDLNAVYKRDDYWINARDAVTADLHERALRTINQLQINSYYPDINPPVFRNGNDTIDVLRKEVPAGYQLTIQHTGNNLLFYYSTDSSDPRGFGGVTQGVNGGTSTTLTIDTTTHVKARTISQTGTTNPRQGNTLYTEWSALHEAMFFVDTDFNDLKITEIMYNPLPIRVETGIEINQIIGNDIEGSNYDLARVELAADLPDAITESDTLVIQGSGISGNNGEFTIHHVSDRDIILKEILTDESNSDATAELLYDGDRYEFIELKNTGTEVINLSGIGFTKGVRFNFQDGILLAPGEFKVIAAQVESFAERYPDVNVDGEYFGKLRNSGEELEISFTTGELFPISSIVGDEGGYGKITLTTLPSALRPYDCIQIKQANNVSNNGIYKIASIQGNQAFVTSVLTDEERGAIGKFFKVIATTEYDDKYPWPLDPDGYGYSLVSAENNPAGNPCNNAYWRTSNHIYGSPGQDELEPSRNPIITLSDRQLTISVAKNADAPPQQFEVWNRGYDVLNYEITHNADWLNVSPSDGILAGESLDRNTHDVTCETSTLTGGIHEAMITVTDPCALNSPQTINVRLEVLTPEIALSTENLTSRVSQGGNAPEQTFNVWNNGIGTLNYSVVTNENWLSVFPDSGSSADQIRQSHTVAFDSDRMALGEYHTTITIVDSDAHNNPQTISVTLTISEEGSFVAYNDLNSTDSINAPNVTGYDYSATNERLKDITTGEDLFVTITGSVTPEDAYDPIGSNGGNFTNVNSDAYQIFDGILDLTGVFELDGPDWSHVLTFNNLEPDKKYTITLTANRDNINYRDQRFTKVTIEGAQSYKNASSAGVIVHSETSISFSTGYNTINGFVAKWTDISPGPDGSFLIISQWDNNYPGSKGYAMSAFRLESDNQ